MGAGEDLFWLAVGEDHSILVGMTWLGSRRLTGYNSSIFRKQSEQKVGPESEAFGPITVTHLSSIRLRLQKILQHS